MSSESPPSEGPPPARQGSSWGLKILLGVLVFGVVIGLKFWNKSSESDDVKQEILKVFKDFEDQQLIRSLVDKHHDACFDACYTMGGRHTSAKFDADRYAQMMGERIRMDLLTRGLLRKSTG